MKKIIPVILSATLLSMGACKKFENTVNKASTHGTLTATAGGKSYTAGSVTVTVTSSAFLISGSTMSSDESLDIAIKKYDKTKSKYTLDYVINTANYHDSKGHHAVSGDVDIQSTGDKSAKGTFSFVTEDSLNVTNGNFDVSWD